MEACRALCEQMAGGVTACHPGMEHLRVALIVGQTFLE